MKDIKRAINGVKKLKNLFDPEEERIYIQYIDEKILAILEYAVEKMTDLEPEMRHRIMYGRIRTK